MVEILVVDDDDQFRAATRFLLKYAGCNVREAGNATRALELVREHHFDLLMTDILMPDMDGIELIQELQRKERRPRIIAVSGGFTAIGAKDRVLHWAQVLGADAVLSKPFEIEDVRRAIEAVLDATTVSLPGVPPELGVPSAAQRELN